MATTTTEPSPHNHEGQSATNIETRTRGESNITDFAGPLDSSDADLPRPPRTFELLMPTPKSSLQREYREEEEEEDWTIRRSVTEEHSTLRQSVTEEYTTHDFPMPRAKRARTAPMRDDRPGLGQRASTLLGGRGRGVTSSPINGGKRDAFEYKFDYTPSDSDSSSSSDGEDESYPTPLMEKAESKLQEDTPADKAEKKAHGHSRFAIGNDFFKTKGRVSRRDGRLKISINETTNSGYVAKALGHSIRNHLAVPSRSKNKRYRAETTAEEARNYNDDAKKVASDLSVKVPRPRLNIVIMVIGSRGDIQPFLRVGQILKRAHGHRVRVATHPVFKDFVEKDGGLEFFSVGGDPSELMAFMVKNPGLIPNMQTIREGEIAKRRTAMAEMFEGFWRACINTTDDEKTGAYLDSLGNREPFIADALIANPPSMAHVHIAERLGIPLHMMFTFPYTPTTEFPHPLANVKARKSNVDAAYVNFMSYPLVEMMTWQGLGDIVNRFRENTLRLEPVSSLWAPGALYRMKVPYTYMWSPGLVPKPPDWGPEIDLSGFVFMDLATNFEPPKDLADFLAAGEPPVYIGFGSIVLDDPDKFTKMIFKAVEMAGVRALVNKGWGGFGGNNDNTPENIFMLGNTPHDWLFPQMKAVVHHGGAGTTAIGLKCAKPTMIIPFFGDQPFWGAMIAKAKAGAHECIPYKKMTAEKLAEGIKQCLGEESQQNVQKIADSIAKEGDGAENAVRSFHRSLPLSGPKSMRCSILQDRVAVWSVKKSSLRLSALAAKLLEDQGKVKWSELKLHRHYKWNDFDGPGEPLSGTVGALSDSLYGVAEGFGMVPIRIARHIRKHEEYERQRRQRQKKRAERERQKRERADTKVTPLMDVEAKDRNADEGRPAMARQETELTMTSQLTVDPHEKLPVEVLEDLEWGLKRAGAAILTMPNDLHVAIAQGFHNAPRLYGDATVRKPYKITGVKSGFVAARKELTYGMYDGWTGLVKQPKGDMEDADTIAAKFTGFWTGFAKGMGGFAIKNTNAVWAPPGFIMKGLFKYIEKKHDGPGSKPHLRKARMIQGQIELCDLQIDVDDDTRGQLRQTEELVEQGWTIYEDVWNAGLQYFGPVGYNVIKRHRWKREIKKWNAAGALENVESAARALEARKQGLDLEKIFAKRKDDIDDADRPRAGALDQPKTFREDADVLPNGLKAGSESPQSREDSIEALERNVSQTTDERSSDTTAMTTPDDNSGITEQTQVTGLGLGELKQDRLDDPGRRLKHVVAVM